MATKPESLNDVARAIQLALAPVFLLTGIAGPRNVMAGRLARIIDRGRGLTERPVAVESSERDSIHRELQSLERRRHFTNVAITAATIASLLLCVARPAGRSDGSHNLSAIVVADRAFPAAVAELDR